MTFRLGYGSQFGSLAVDASCTETYHHIGRHRSHLIGQSIQLDNAVGGGQTLGNQLRGNTLDRLLTRGINVEEYNAVGEREIGRQEGGEEKIVILRVHNHYRVRGDGSEGYFITQDAICRGGYEVNYYLYGNVQSYCEDADWHLIRETVENLNTIIMEV